MTTAMRRSTSLLLAFLLAVWAPAAAADPPGKCKGTKVLYKGRCLYPDEVRRMKRAGRNKVPRKGKAGVSKNLRSQLKQLLRWSKSDFRDLRLDRTMSEDNEGDRNYKVKASFKACGPKTSYNKVWHWRSMKGNWEYVCDVDFNTERAANAYYTEMVRQLKGARGYTWEREVRVNDTTTRRLVGRRANPPIKIMLDFDREANGFEVEFWFKQKNNPGAAGGGPVVNAGGGGDLRGKLKQLVKWSRNNFSAIRINNTRKTMSGADKYQVRGFNACGPQSKYNKVWHWRSMKGNWEYVCDVDFPNHRAATAYYDAMAAQLRSTRGFRWDKEQWISKTTRRRIEGHMRNPRIKVMFDYDANADGTVEVELWFKQKFNR